MVSIKLVILIILMVISLILFFSQSNALCLILSYVALLTSFFMLKMYQVTAGWVPLLIFGILLIAGIIIWHIIHEEEGTRIDFSQVFNGNAIVRGFADFASEKVNNFFGFDGTSKLSPVGNILNLVYTLLSVIYIIIIMIVRREFL